MEHGLGGVVQPLPFLSIQMAEDRFARRGRTEVDVRGFPSHGVEQAKFGIGAAQRSEFDAAAMGAEAANDPASAQLDERIGTADGAVDDGLVEDFGGTFAPLSLKTVRPTIGGRHERLGFAGDAAAVPIGDGHVAGVAEAAESGGAVREAIRDAGSGHEMFEGIDGAYGDVSLHSGQRVHLLPEVDGIAKFAFGDEAKPPMLLAEDEGATFFAHAFVIAIEQGVANVLALEGEASGLDGEMGADGEAHQIDGVRHRPGFVKVVDAPDKAAFDVPPGAEVFHVQIADRERARSLGEIGANLRPELRPAVVSGAQKHEQVSLHVGVFQAKVFLVDGSAQSEPVFEQAGSFDDVHAGNDSGGGAGSQMDRRAFHPEAQSHREKPLLVLFPQGFLCDSVSLW